MFLVVLPMMMRRRVSPRLQIVLVVAKRLHAEAGGRADGRAAHAMSDQRAGDAADYRALGLVVMFGESGFRRHEQRDAECRNLDFPGEHTVLLAIVICEDGAVRIISNVDRLRSFVYIIQRFEHLTLKED